MNQYKLALLSLFLLVVSPLSHADVSILFSDDTLIPSTEIRIIFEKAVVDVDSIDTYSANNLLISKPRIEGELLWESTNVAVFIPSKPVKMDTDYTFSIKAGQSYRDKSKIPVGREINIQSDEFRMQRQRMISEKIKVTREPNIYLCFNDSIIPQKKTSYFVFINESGGEVAAKSRRAKWGDIKNEYFRGDTWGAVHEEYVADDYPDYSDEDSALIPNGLVVSPVEPLPIGEGWRLHVLKGIPNQSKSAKTMEKESIRIGDVEPFEVKYVQAHIKADEPRQIHIELSYPLADSQLDVLSDFIEIQPEVNQLKYSIKDNKIIIDGDLRENEKWSVTVKKDLIAMNGLKSEKDFLKKETFGHAYTELVLPSFDSAQLAHGRRLYPLRNVNLESLHIRVKELTPEQAIRVIQGYQQYKGIGYNEESISPMNAIPYALVTGKTIYNKKEELESILDTTSYFELDWAQVTPFDNKVATYFLSIEGTANSETSKDDRIGQALIQLTDIGLVWKINGQEAVIYAFSNQTGEPLENVRIQVFGEDAKLLSEGKEIRTNSNGLVRVQRNDATRHLHFSRGEDNYIVQFDDKLSGNIEWRSRISEHSSSADIWKKRALLFTDRKLYRPGETVHLKGVVRQYLDNQVKRIDNKQARLVIKNSDDGVYVDQQVTISENGTFDHSMTLPEELVGAVRVILTISGEAFHVFEHHFDVQEFRRNAFKQETNISEIKTGDDIATVGVKASYYQGGSMAGSKVVWRWDVKQINFRAENFPNFSFGEQVSYSNGYKSSSTGETTLNEQGLAEVEIKLVQPKRPYPREVSIYTGVTDTRDQQIAGYDKKVIHPADIYIGVSRGDSEMYTDWENEFEIISVDTEGHASQEGVEVTVTIEFAPNDPFIDNLERATILKKELVIPAGKSIFLSFVPQLAGRHIMKVRGDDKNGHRFSTTKILNVYSPNDQKVGDKDNTKMELLPDKKSYQIGDIARILLSRSITGTALVTVERSDVQREFIVELKADNPVIEIPILSNDTPNVFISVTVTQGAGASEAEYKTPVQKYGECKLKVENTEDRLGVTLNVKGDKHRPSEPTMITGMVTNVDGSPAVNAELVLYVVDEGALEVSGYRMPNPMESFHKLLPLGVTTGLMSANAILEDPARRIYGNTGFMINTGNYSNNFGGAGMGGVSFFGSSRASEKAMPKLRANFNPCAVWLPRLTTDNKGYFSTTYNNPDTLTSYRVMAVAFQGDDQFGRAKTEYMVDKPLMIEPTAPRYASQGDKLKPKALLQNKSEYTGEWEVSLTTSDISKAANNTELKKMIKLEPGASATVYFDIEFHKTGTAKWVWVARPLSIEGYSSIPAELKLDLSDQVETSFEVTFPVPLMRQVSFVSLKGNESKDLLAAIDANLLEGRGSIELTCSNSLLLEASGAVEYLLKYPYGCIEQTTSSLMPWFTVRDLQSLVPSFGDKSEEDIQKAIQGGANRIMSMQTYEGGFSYWPGGDEPEYWASSYAGMGLLLAKKHGANVSDRAILKLTDWLSNSLKEQTYDFSKIKNQWSAETYARSLYVLALAGKPEVLLQNGLLEKKRFLNPIGQAFLALAINASGDQQTAVALLGNKATRRKSKHWMNHHADSAMTALAWCEISPIEEQLDLQMHKMLSTRSSSGHWRTTWCNSWALQAIASYAKNVEVNRKTTTLKLTSISGEQSLTLNDENPTKSVIIPLEPEMQLLVSASSKIYVHVKIQSKPKIAPSGSIAKGGLVIARSYHKVMDDGTRTPMVTPHVGDLIQIDLDVSFAGDSNYVVVEDRIPAIFEIVNNEFKSQKSRFVVNSDHSWLLSHKELRSDRAIFFIDQPRNNAQQTISYLARVTTAGEAIAPAAKVEAMYNPEQVALSESDSMTAIQK